MGDGRRDVAHERRNHGAERERPSHDEAPTRDGMRVNLCGAEVSDDDETWTEEGTPFRDSEEVLGGLFEKKRNQIKIIPSAVFSQTLYYRVILGKLTFPKEKSRQGWVRCLQKASYLVKSS